MFSKKISQYQGYKKSDTTPLGLLKNIKLFCREFLIQIQIRIGNYLRIRKGKNNL
jgi:hypothetical protein